MFCLAMGTGGLSFGGRLISSACGVRNTVVTMKKMSSRKATSTSGVMSMRMPGRAFFLPLPPPPGCGVSTAPMVPHLLRSMSPGGRGRLGRRAAEGRLLLRVGDDVETVRVRRLQVLHDLLDDAERRILVRLQQDERRRGGIAGRGQPLLEVLRRDLLVLLLLPLRELHPHPALAGHVDGDDVRLRLLELRGRRRERDLLLLRRLELRRRHEEDEEQERDVDQRRHVDRDADSLGLADLAHGSSPGPRRPSPWPASTGTARPRTTPRRSCTRSCRPWS